jgi:leucyl/phenylalanyl-tRNA--protein transferase
MPVFRLSEDEIIFPDPSLAERDGLLALGGDLSTERLLHAYESGIFPWYNEGEPILWFSPNPRCVLLPESLKVSRSMRQVLRKEEFEIRYDTAFAEVIEACAEISRHGQSGTWITEDMKDAYKRLHAEGYAHSAEAWQDGELVGGLYGVSLGSAFFGESMFARRSNASKAAFITLVQKLEREGFRMIDCQTPTRHLASLGAINIKRSDFLVLLRNCLRKKTRKGNWSNLQESHESIPRTKR